MTKELQIDTSEYPSYFKQLEVEGMTIRYEIFRPADNDTALVEGIIEDRLLRKIINDRIIQENPNIEQVGFVDFSDVSKPMLMMAGLELCGNALRSFMYYLCLMTKGRIRESVIQVRMQDKSLFLQAGVNGFQQTWAELPH